MNRSAPEPNPEPELDSSASESESAETAADVENPELPPDEASELDEDDIDGFSIEALSRAYARAVSKQNAAEESGTDSDSADAAAAKKDTPSASTANASDLLDEAETEESSEPADVSQTDPTKHAVSVAAADDADADLDDDADNAACPLSPETILEAMLFVGNSDGSPMKSKSLAGLMRGVSPREVNQLVKELNRSYEQHSQPFRIERRDGGFCMTLTESAEPVRQKFYGEVRPAALSQQAIDVLSLVAYNQPVSREQLEKTRGKPCGGVLKQLERRNLIVAEFKDGARKPEFSTTDRFLDLFGIGSLEDLPRTGDPDLAD